MVTLKKMIEILQAQYRIRPSINGNNIILIEENNAGNSNALYKIELNIRDVEDFAVYKFDQKDVEIDHYRYETHMPILSAGRHRCMCDFIIFYHPKRDLNKLYAWVVNLKSNNLDNNLPQLRAGKRLCEFLLGKLDDELKRQDKPENLSKGNVDFVLFCKNNAFSQPQRFTTNSRKAKQNLSATSNKGDGSSPENFFRVSNKSYNIQPLSSA